MDLIVYEDPDPIYICQEGDLCPIVEGGKVTINSTFVAPRSGPSGTIFNFGITYNVVNATGPGLLMAAVLPPENGEALESSQFTEGQPPGKYSIQWSLDTTSSEQQTFISGLYQVVMAVCAGDCTTAHPYGGIYAQSQTTFTITESQ